MNKEAYYFSHDSNARQDEKILALRMKHGWEGYGIFWAIVEKLRESTDYILDKNYNIISYDLRVSSDKVKSIIEDFGLFVFTDNGKHFYSERLLSNMTYKSERGKKAANARWNKPENQTVNAHALQVHSERIASGMQNDASKGKESKEKERREGEVDSVGNSEERGVQSTPDTPPRDVALELSILKFFGYSEMPQWKNQQVLISDFCRYLESNSLKDHFKSQFESYKKFCALGDNMTYRFQLNNYLGRQEEKWNNGKWNICNWEEKLKNENLKHNSNQQGNNSATVVSLPKSLRKKYGNN